MQLFVMDDGMAFVEIEKDHWIPIGDMAEEDISTPLTDLVDRAIMKQFRSEHPKLFPGLTTEH